jgi:hypothetical protein
MAANEADKAMMKRLVSLARMMSLQLDRERGARRAAVRIET